MSFSQHEPFSNRVNPPKLAPTVELTFDDSPRDPYAVRSISETLRLQNIRCDFFTIGNVVKKHSDVLYLLNESGHSVQNHSWSHCRLDRLGRKSIRNELERTQQVIFDTVGVTPTKIRPPFGAGMWNRNEAPILWTEIERLSLQNSAWDVDSDDWKGPKGISAEKIEAIRIQIMRKIDHKHLVILFHATKETAADLPRFLDQLRQWNLAIVSHSKCDGTTNVSNAYTRELAFRSLQKHREKNFHSIWKATESNFRRLKRLYERQGCFKLPDSLLATLVAGEDKRYLTHSGFDIWSIGRACWRRLLGKHEGASTIPQQLARVLTGRYERSISRKLLEIRLACRMSRKFSKADIATLYLHIAYYGWRMNSLEQAAHRLKIQLTSCSLHDAAKLVARLKYPQPKDPNSAKRKFIQAREAHLIKLVKNISPSELLP